jgi:hypothetical protein
MIQLHKIKVDEFGYNRMFRAIFKPDPKFEDWQIGMRFEVISVNRETGEVQFSLDSVTYRVPEDDT